MNIGVVHPILELLGGAEQTTKNILQALVDNGHDTTLYTMTDQCIKIPDGVHVKKHRLLFNTPLSIIYETDKLFKSIKNCDLVLVSSGGLSLPSHNYNKKTIIYCHSTFESDLKYISMKIRGKFWLYKKYLQRCTKRNINALKNSSFNYITNSLYTKNKIKELFNIDSLVIYPPVKMLPSQQQKRKGIVTISRFSPEKNLEFNIDVVKEMPVTYNIYGNMNLRYQHTYLKQLKKVSSGYSNIKLLENNSRERVECGLNYAKVYFQNSKETFGIAVIEGIVAGCIPIVPDHTANIETVPFKELRFKEGDKTDASQKIKLALSGNYDKYLPKLQEHVKQFTEENFRRNIISYISKMQ